MVSRFLALGVNKKSLTPEHALFAPTLFTSEKTQSLTLKELNLENKQPILALCPGAAFGPAKRWPTKYFGTIAKQKLSEGWQVWILGGESDRSLASEICEQADGCTDLTGKTTLENTIDLLSLATVAISNDSGLMHIAASLDTALIALYGSSSPTFTPPLNAKAHILGIDDLPCRPCFQRTCPLQHFKCMIDLTPDKLLPLIEEMAT